MFLSSTYPVVIVLFRLVRCNLYDEIKIRRSGSRPQRLESLFGLFSGRPSGIVLPCMNDHANYIHADFEDVRKACLDMTDFVFPSFDEQFILASVRIPFLTELRKNYQFLYRIKSPICKNTELL